MDALIREEDYDFIETGLQIQQKKRELELQLRILHNRIQGSSQVMCWWRTQEGRRIITDYLNITTLYHIITYKLNLPLWVIANCDDTRTSVSAGRRCLNHFTGLYAVCEKCIEKIDSIKTSKFTESFDIFHTEDDKEMTNHTIYKTLTECVRKMYDTLDHIDKYNNENGYDNPFAEELLDLYEDAWNMIATAHIALRQFQAIYEGTHSQVDSVTYSEAKQETIEKANDILEHADIMAASISEEVVELATRFHTIVENKPTPDTEK